MNGEFDVFREKLLTRQAELQTRLDNLKKDATRKANADWSEQAQERENDEVVDALGNEAIYELRLIQKALEKIKEDEYGICAGCGNDIPKARLEVMPYAELCVKCAEARGQ
ncbi:TraR/DksA family transcriptional regulator [Sansalvadorimonas sp. 2012CJ34-2]|uniref:TraR/DksA family transcriptional regulator n=1 Tax=Parendozoicomonas callyspongiae TaxID=2942213 RepID=A0ABT0PP13_9GAMM|nr:TraR/DksA family transcriptional regulator [Sansalvadorimonas sp. 2012CJ34-2]MCL6272188.1 TraR/DksA family transcriptional regulator [Sansalvadorimonas sp. 2012CJ34-2]